MGGILPVNNSMAFRYCSVEVWVGFCLRISSKSLSKPKLPAKRFGEAVPEFRLVPNKPVLEGKFVPIKPEEPFAYIERLKDAYLTQREEQLGIIVKEAGT